MFVNDYFIFDIIIFTLYLNLPIGFSTLRLAGPRRYRVSPDRSSLSITPLLIRGDWVRSILEDRNPRLVLDRLRREMD